VGLAAAGAVTSLAPFVPFGPAHLGTLAVVGTLALALVRLVRARPAAARPVRVSLFAGIVLFLVFELSVGAREGWLTLRTVLPLELCDAAMLLALATLARPTRPAAELLYFWAGAGSTLAMLTPDLPWAFPRWEFVVFFGLHGLVLVAALVLVFGLGLQPRPGAPLRALAATAAWALLAGAVDVALGANFMYLRGKPAAATPLDWMGPWPAYIATAAVVALVLYSVLALPFRGGWRLRGPDRPPPRPSC
jgi:hypothetical integral membrane protein (TIGR02206 family)